MTTATQTTLWDIEWRLEKTNDELRRQAVAAERQAAALEGLLALLTARLPAAAPAAAPDPVPTPADAFAELTRNVPIGIALNDAKVGEEVLVKLTFAAPAADPGDEDDSDADDYTRRTRWAKYDPRCRELARLRTSAKHRARAAKTTEVRAACLREGNSAKTESNNRQQVLRQWLATGKVVIDGDTLYRINADGSRDAWQSSFLTLK